VHSLVLINETATTEERILSAWLEYRSVYKTIWSTLDLQCFLNWVLCTAGSRSSSDISCLATDWNLRGWTRFDPRQGQRIFPLISESRPALGPTQPPVQWVPGVLSPGVKSGRGVRLTTRPI